jgi:hypothetical protein
LAPLPLDWLVEDKTMVTTLLICVDLPAWGESFVVAGGPALAGSALDQVSAWAASLPSAEEEVPQVVTLDDRRRNMLRETEQYLSDPASRGWAWRPLGRAVSAAV